MKSRQLRDNEARSRSVYVGRVSPDVPQTVLLEIFGCVGEIVGIREVSDAGGTKDRDVGSIIIDYREAEAANAAVALAGTEIGEWGVTVEKAVVADHAPVFSRRIEALLERIKVEGSSALTGQWDLTADRKFMLEAVKLNGKALAFASDELRADKEVVLAAVKHNGRAIEAASEKLQVDSDVILQASDTNPRALSRAYYKR